MKINTIINDDCLNVMRSMPDKCVDLVLTDPPYGVSMDGGFSGFGGFGGFGEPIRRRTYNNKGWDDKRPHKIIFDEMNRISRLQIIWGGNFFADLLPQSTHWIFWDKIQTMPTFGDGELAYTNSKRKSIKKVTIEWNGLLGKEAHRMHPTQKPLKLFTWCIEKYSKPNDLIFDPFSGSGTTAIAAHQLGRRFICVEKEKEYYKKSVERLNECKMQTDLFSNNVEQYIKQETLEFT